MKYRLFSLAVTLGLTATAPLALAQSPALQDSMAAAAKVDISKFFTSRTDARSQSFGFGGTHEHAFTVDKSGRYVFTSATMVGMSNDYSIQATLLDAQGNVIASGDGLGATGGLHLVETLEPGDYVLRVKANKFGSEASGNGSFTVQVAGLSASGERLSSEESGIDGGTGIMFDASDDDGTTTAFVTNEDAVATIAAPKPVATAANETVVDAAPQAEEGAPRAFDEIIADIKIRQQGKVLSFDVAEAGTISITSSTMIGRQGDYRLEARVLDAGGNVVASDAGEGFEGDFAIETVLQPGRYTIWVDGRKFGPASSGSNNYTLRVQQLDTLK